MSSVGPLGSTPGYIHQVGVIFVLVRDTSSIFVVQISLALSRRYYCIFWRFFCYLALRQWLPMVASHWSNGNDLLL